MRKVTAYALLQLACWIGRIGFRAAGVDLRESLVMLQIVPTPERLKREADEREAYWAGVFQELRRKTELGGGIGKSLDGGGDVNQAVRPPKGWSN